MYNITAYLTIKNKTFYTVLTYYVDGQRKLKWISTGIKANESKKKAEKKEDKPETKKVISKAKTANKTQKAKQTKTHKNKTKHQQLG